jgi:glutathione S-transferase
MQLFGSPASPFVRKVRIVLEEKRIPHEYVIERPSAPGSRVPQFNPLGKIPVLVLDSGRAIYDSAVIVEYLDGISGDPKMIPADFEQRIEVRRWEALADGVADATVAVNHEYREPADKQRPAAWFEKQRQKIGRGLDIMERDLSGQEFCFGTRFSLADIATVYALGYLDYALPQDEWRSSHPGLARFAERMAQRDSCARTVQT